MSKQSCQDAMQAIYDMASLPRPTDNVSCDAYVVVKPDWEDELRFVAYVEWQVRPTQHFPVAIMQADAGWGDTPNEAILEAIERYRKQYHT